MAPTDIKSYYYNQGDNISLKTVKAISSTKAAGVVFFETSLSSYLFVLDTTLGPGDASFQTVFTPVYVTTDTSHIMSHAAIKDETVGFVSFYGQRIDSQTTCLGEAAPLWESAFPIGFVNEISLTESCT